MDLNIDKTEKIFLEDLIRNSSSLVNLKKKKDLCEIKETADKIYSKINPINYDSIEEFYSSNPTIPLMFKIALKLAKSKYYVYRLKDEAHISINLAMYNEHNRILQLDKHPNGEDFLNVKLDQLDWLFKDFKNYHWELILIDDGCPNDSCKIAQKIISDNKYKNVEVLFLEEAIAQKIPVTKGLKDTKESQKGGSILYGMYHSTKITKKNHVVIYTDADLSTHLGQLGLLIKPIIEDNYLSAIGSRRENSSVVIKQGKRNDRGKLFIYSWKRMLPELNYIIDTQCGFKAFDAKIVNDIIAPSIEKKFAFDIELILKTENIRKNSIYKVPIAWIDSEAESTTTDLQPYLPMLKSIAKMYNTYSRQKTDIGNNFANFYDRLTKEKWEILLKNIPSDITKRNPIEFSSYDKVTVSELEYVTR